ncbi:CEP1 [Symbiodinium sp. KB8]|nr:CEP1 [Symbiodinium sp. KB8]
MLCHRAASYRLTHVVCASGPTTRQVRWRQWLFPQATKGWRPERFEHEGQALQFARQSKRIPIWKLGMAARTDPFLTDVEVPDYKATASHAEAARREHMVSQEVAVLIFVPWSCYVFMVLAFALPPSGFLWSLLAGVSWLASLLVARQAYERHLRGASPVYKLLALMVLLSCVAGPLVGAHIEQRKMASYWMHKTGATYRDVVPTKPSDAYQDASILDFAASARLDLQRTLGIRSPGSGMTYCIAPVIDTSSSTKQVNYFAADVNCCEPRRSFLCGDTAKADARTGVVLPAKSSQHAADRWQHFFKAAQQAAEVYGWDLPDRPIFVRWFEDAEGVQSELLHQGLVEAFVQCFAGLCAAVIVAMWLHWSLSYYVQATSISRNYLEKVEQGEARLLPECREELERVLGVPLKRRRKSRLDRTP